MNRTSRLIVLFVLAGCAHGSGFRSPAGHVADESPILGAVENNGQTLSDDTTHWMKKWKGIDLEQSSIYSFPKLTGSTSVNLKIQEKDPSKTNGFESLGIFLAPNDSGNPTAELAYFNMAAILGWDNLMRPSIPYSLGPVASNEFLTMLNAPNAVSSDQQDNANKIKKLIATGNPLQGCLKADNDSTANAVDSMCAPSPLTDNGGPNLVSPILVSLQVTNPAPVSGPLLLMPGFTGDALQLAIEYSVVMTFDTIFQQGDRYSGGNLGVRKDANGQAHFYSSDNGGAYLDDDVSTATMNLSWFSRYDRKTIDGLRKINQFLLHPATGFLGYHDSAKFVSDLGFYFEMAPADSARILQRNIQLVLDKVDATVAKYGSTTYLN